jgi:hypothetical protein
LTRHILFHIIKIIQNRENIMRKKQENLSENFINRLRRAGFGKVDLTAFNANSGDIFSHDNTSGQQTFQICRDVNLTGKFGRANPGLNITIDTNAITVNPVHVYPVTPRVTGMDSMTHFLRGQREFSLDETDAVFDRVRALKRRGMPAPELSELK